MPRVEVAQRGLEQVEQGRGRGVLDGEAVGELGDVPARRDAHQIVTERRIDRARLRTGEDVELAATRELIGGVRQRLRVPGHTARRATYALRDDMKLADVAAEQHDDE